MSLPGNSLPVPSTITPSHLDDEMLVAIGRLIRAFAEIDDLITFHICSLTGINESEAVLMFGRMSISGKLATAYSLARLKGDTILEGHNVVFRNEAFPLILDCRNALAHGVYLGLDEHGRHAFLTNKSDLPEVGKSVRTVQAYSPDAIRTFSKTAEGLVEVIQEGLQLDPFRKERLSKSLQPRNRGTRKRSQPKRS